MQFSEELTGLEGINYLKSALKAQDTMRGGSTLYSSFFFKNGIISISGHAFGLFWFFPHRWAKESNIRQPPFSENESVQQKPYTVFRDKLGESPFTLRTRRINAPFMWSGYKMAPFQRLHSPTGRMPLFILVLAASFVPAQVSTSSTPLHRTNFRLGLVISLLIVSSNPWMPTI